MEKNDVEIDGNTGLYELGFLLAPSLSDQEALAETSKFQALIEKQGGKALETHNPQLKGLSYEMRRGGGSRELVDKAYFGTIIFEGNSIISSDLNVALKDDSGVIRHSLVRLPKEALIQRERRVGGSIQRTKRVEKSSEPISEAEIDKTIEDLVIK